MNVQITGAIAAQTNAEVSYNEHRHGAVTYHIAKDVNGRKQQVSVTVSGQKHAEVSGEKIAEQVVTEAAKKFADLRAKLPHANAGPIAPEGKREVDIKAEVKDEQPTTPLSPATPPTEPYKVKGATIVPTKAPITDAAPVKLVDDPKVNK